MKKALKAGVFSALLSGMMLSTVMLSYAGSWQSDGNGWQWKNDDGSTPSNCWQWIDGNSDGVSESYYFDANGYCLINTQTPDGFTVNASGAWVENGVIQTKQSDGSTSQETLSPKANLQDITPDASARYDKTERTEYTAGGESFDGASQYRVGNGDYDAYADFYLGGQYTKLTFKATPRTDTFTNKTIDTLIVSDQQTGKELAKKEITVDTKKFEMTVDVTGVEYLRIRVHNQLRKGYGGRFGYLFIKDAYLY